MKKLLVWLLYLGLVGCASVGNLDKLRVENRQNILRIQIGMTKSEVLNIMGNKFATDVYLRNLSGSNQFTVNNPYRSEILQGKDKVFEIIYYYTDVKKTQQYFGAIFSVQDDELTPLVFDNGKLIGWGWSFLQDNVQKYELRMR